MEVRRDNKGRILRAGETQRKDGRYSYSIQDNGRRVTFYSWTLTDADKAPAGKKAGPSLRTQVKEYEDACRFGIDIAAANITVKELLDMYIDLKSPTVKASTVKNYHGERNRIAKTSIYFEKINNLNLLKCKQWALELKALGIKGDTIKKTKNLLQQALNIAVENDWILKNPCDFKLSSAIGKLEYEERYPLTDEWQKKYLEYVAMSNTYSFYYDAIYVLLNTGLRISEFCGLTKQDVNFKEGYINVSKQLLPSIEYSGRHIDTTKTDNAVRKIPMTDKVAEKLKKAKKAIGKRKVNPSVGGVKDFLFISKRETAMDSKCWDKIFRRIYAGFTKKYPEYEKQEHFSPITPHILRHTFCTNLVKAGVDEKSITSIVGHSTYATTLNIYTHYDYKTISDDFRKKYSAV